MNEKTVLIVGVGSIGSRHMRNALSLGWTVKTWDPKNSSETLLQVLKQYEASKAIICSPPEHHASQTKLCLTYGLSVLCEKPLAMNLEEVVEVQDCLRDERRNGRSDIDCRVAYQMRFLPSLRTCRIDASVAAATDPLSIVHVTYGLDVKKWDRQTPYETVCGALLECSHELDYVCWMFGNDPLPAVAGVDVYGEPDSAVTALLRWKSVVAVVSVDILSLKHRREFALRSANYDIRWEYDSEEGEEAYRKELTAFLEGGDEERYLCTIEEAVEVHALIDTIKNLT